MRKITTLSMIAFLLLVMSCKKDKEHEFDNAGSGFRATVESHSGNDKTHLSGLSVIWDNGDAVLVKSSTCTAAKRFTTTDNGVVANFVAAEDLPSDFYTPSYTAYYPADAFEGDQLTLPQTQTYDAEMPYSFAIGANPMAASASSGSLLPFKNVCGVLVLPLYSEAKECYVDNISITSLDDEMLWGTGTVTIADGVPELGSLSNGGNTLILDCGGELMSTDWEHPSFYCFVVPAGTLGRYFSVKVTETNGDEMIKSAESEDNLIARSVITVMPELDVYTEPTSSVYLNAYCSDCTFSMSGSFYVNEESACECGIVYGTTNPPTIDDTKIAAHTMSDPPVADYLDFDVDLPPLDNNVYYVRAYAIVDDVVRYSENVEIAPMPLASNWIDGKSPKTFTVGAGADGIKGTSDDIKVYFSQGNLQYRAKGGVAGDACATAEPGEYAGGTWRFAEHQSDIIAQGNNNAALDYEGWIDLFSWGTSGYNHGANCYQPWNLKDYDYQWDFAAYGDYAKHLYDEDGTADWGANTIYVGSTPTDGWRTLTGDTDGEWQYLLKERNNAARLFGGGKIGNCATGIIILPDDWTLPAGLTFYPGGADQNTQNYPDGKKLNAYTYDEWYRMEQAGAVFLPAAGDRGNGTTGVEELGRRGGYWSSIHEAPAHASDFGIYIWTPNNPNNYFLNIYPRSSQFRYRKHSVRLVKNAN